jgi:Arc/MetJ-type ribon-helix-helix transcriptional regulator
MEKNNKGKYTTVHIPTVLAEIIDQIIDSEECAYSSRSEFIKDAIRRFLEYYGYRPTINRNPNSPELRAELQRLNNSR